MDVDSLTSKVKPVWCLTKFKTLACHVHIFLTSLGLGDLPSYLLPVSYSDKFALIHTSLTWAWGCHHAVQLTVGKK